MSHVQVVATFIFETRIGLVYKFPIDDFNIIPSLPQKKMEKQARSNNICNFRILRSNKRRIPLPDPDQPTYACQECSVEFKAERDLRFHGRECHPKLSKAVMEKENHSESSVSSPLVPILPPPKETLRKAQTQTSPNLLQSPTVSSPPAAVRRTCSNPPTLSDSFMELITPTCPPNDYWMPMDGDISPAPLPSAEFEPIASSSSTSSVRRIRADFGNHQDNASRQGGQGDDVVLLCPICNEAKLTKGAMFNHIDMHKGKKPFLCHVCGWAYETEMKLLEHHIIKHGMEPIFQCGRCGKKYKREGTLRRHKCANPPPSASS